MATRKAITIPTSRISLELASSSCASSVPSLICRLFEFKRESNFLLEQTILPRVRVLHAIKKTSDLAIAGVFLSTEDRPTLPGTGAEVS
jgi:hypothetical protein